MILNPPLLTIRNRARKVSIKGLPPVPDFGEGGQWLVDAALKYGVNERGDKLQISQPFLETLRLLGDFRISSVYTSGGAQIWKTLSHWQLVSALITTGRHDFAWIYPQMSLISKLVPSQFKPIIGSWESQTGLDRKQAASDSKSMMIHQSTFGTGRFASANNDAAASKTRDGTASANTNVVSFSSDLAVYEERSQYTQKSVDAIRRRFLQSRVPTRPERLLGTPGNGGGIEMEIAAADFEFWPYVYCSGCGELSKLSPLGWLLKGDYFDDAGRPLDWHYSDKNNKVDSAYFGCPHCSAPITPGERMAAHFRCCRTGRSLTEVLDNLSVGWPAAPISAGIILSPLLRDSGLNPAVDLITKGLSGADVPDWHQQELGLPTKNSDTGISVTHIKAATKLEPPIGEPDRSVWGLDQGTTEHWLVVIDYFYNDGNTPMQLYENATRRIKYIKSVGADSLDNFISDCDGGSIDNEPGREYAARMIQQYNNSFAFDQRGGRELGGLVSKSGKVEAGGESMDVVLCDTHRLQNMILTSFDRSLVVLPNWVDSQDMSANSPTRHLTTSSRDRETGKWKRPDDHKDDLLKAFMACELWFYLDCTADGGVSFGDERLL